MKIEENNMASVSFRSSRPDSWISPRPHSDPSARFMKHGAIRPMEQPGFWARLLGTH
jgi:hypothetical protein